MRPLTAMQVLDVWERAWALAPMDRALEIWMAGSGRDDVADLPIGARERAMLALREAMFGSAIDAVAACPACGESVEMATDVRDLVQAGPATPELSISVDGLDVTCRPLSSAVIAEAKRMQKRSGTAGDRLSLREALARGCVVSARRGDDEVEAAALPAPVLDAIEDALAAADPDADIRFALRCPHCEHEWEAAFDAAGYLWAELDAHARALISDIDVLASAYGWPERAILDLSPTRRRLYVEMVSR